MPGTYAPPAVELPKTSAIVGIPAADSRVRSRKICPPGMKISFWRGQVGAAGLDEVDQRQPVLPGDLIARSVFFSVHGLLGAAAHGRVVGDDHALDALDHADAGDHAGPDG